LRDGWARTAALTDQPQSAEFRLADTLTGRETTELALPMVDICLPGGVRAAVCADPRFSTLFTLRQAADGAVAVAKDALGGKSPVNAHPITLVRIAYGL
jgi:hypothetical protein